MESPELEPVVPVTLHTTIGVVIVVSSLVSALLFVVLPWIAPMPTITTVTTLPVEQPSDRTKPGAQNITVTLADGVTVVLEVYVGNMAISDYYRGINTLRERVSPYTTRGLLQTRSGELTRDIGHITIDRVFYPTEVVVQLDKKAQARGDMIKGMEEERMAQEILRKQQQQLSK